MKGFGLPTPSWNSSQASGLLPFDTEAAFHLWMFVMLRLQ